MLRADHVLRQPAPARGIPCGRWRQPRRQWRRRRGSDDAACCTACPDSIAPERFLPGNQGGARRARSTTASKRVHASSISACTGRTRAGGHFHLQPPPGSSGIVRRTALPSRAARARDPPLSAACAVEALRRLCSPDSQLYSTLLPRDPLSPPRSSDVSSHLDFRPCRHHRRTLGTERLTTTSRPHCRLGSTPNLRSARLTKLDRWSSSPAMRTDSTVLLDGIDARAGPAR